MHIQTLWVHPEYNVGFTEPSKIDVVIQLYEIPKPENIVWESRSPTRIEVKAVLHKRELRIGTAYSILAMSMSWLLKKEAK